jgi:hypothetical protein
MALNQGDRAGLSAGFILKRSRAYRNEAALAAGFITTDNREAVGASDWNS